MMIMTMMSVVSHSGGMVLTPGMVTMRAGMAAVIHGCGMLWIRAVVAVHIRMAVVPVGISTWAMPCVMRVSIVTGIARLMQHCNGKVSYPGKCIVHFIV